MISKLFCLAPILSYLYPFLFMIVHTFLSICCFNYQHVTREKTDCMSVCYAGHAKHFSLVANLPYIKAPQCSCS